MSQKSQDIWTQVGRGWCSLPRWSKLKYCCNRAERLRLESAKYHGTKSAKAAHNLAIGLIRKNILQKSDKMENKVKLGGWRGLEIFCGEVWHTSRQIKKAFQQIKEESQENPNLKGPVKDMEQAINHLEEASEFLIELGNRLEGWHDLCYSDSEQDDEGDNAEDDDDSDWETLNSQGDEDHDRHGHS